MSDETISPEDYQHLVAFHDASLKLSVLMVLKRKEPIDGVDDIGGPVHSSAHAAAAFYHGTHASAHNAAMYVERLHQTKLKKKGG
jgi:hypothetical protein